MAGILLMHGSYAGDPGRFRPARHPKYRPGNLRRCRVSRCRNPNRHHRRRRRRINRPKYRAHHRHLKRAAPGCSRGRRVCRRGTPGAGLARRREHRPNNVISFSPIADLMSGELPSILRQENGESHVNATGRRQSTGHRNTDPAPATPRGQLDGVRRIAGANRRNRPPTRRYAPVPGYGSRLRVSHAAPARPAGTA